MHQKLLKAGFAAMALPLLTACIDTGYDLSDIDTTTQIKVNDLVIPVKLDVVTLGDIITIDEDSEIKIVDLEGKKFYAVSQSGDFHSDPIEVPEITAVSPTVEKAHAVFRLLETPAKAPAMGAPSASVTYTIRSFTPRVIEFNATDIDECIHGVDAIGSQLLPVDLSFVVNDVDAGYSLVITDMDVQFLRGLHIASANVEYTYDPKTGIFHVKNLAFDANHKAVFHFEIDRVDFNNDDARFSYDQHRLDYRAEILVDNATMTATYTGGGYIPEAPETIESDIETASGAMVARTFSGTIQYTLEGNTLDIDPVDLTDLPDFLAGESTDLKLANPQIYLQVNNPLNFVSLNCQTGLRLTAVRDEGMNRRAFEPDNGGIIFVEHQPGNPVYNFVLSPKAPASPLPEFASGIKHVAFTSLSDVLSGNGMPQSIEIDLIDPQVPLQKVVDFPLQHNYEGFQGRYDFLAPLALKSGPEGSVIVYTDTQDGWGDEDVEKMTIETLELEADVTSTIPLNASLTARPIDVNGNKLDVTVEGADIEAFAENKHIHIRTTGTIQGLDGVYFEAVVRPADNEEPLSPEQTIKLENIRIKVSGYYTTEF